MKRIPFRPQGSKWLATPTLSPDDPKSYPVRLHIRFVTNDGGLLNANKGELLIAMGLHDVMSLSEIHSKYLSEHKKEDVAVIGKEIISSDEEMIIVESPVIDERICDIGYMLLADPNNPRIPGVTRDESKGRFWFRVGKFKALDTEEFHGEREWYYKTLKNPVDF